MGACCAPGADSGPKTLTDLPAPTVEGINDVYQRFELQTVFARTAFGPFYSAVEKAAGVEEGQINATVTFDALAAALNTPLWKTLSDSGSELRKLLEQPAFQSSESDLSAGQIDTTKLIMFALLNSVDGRAPMKKARAFYCILQEGGFERHEQISAGDKDFKPAFKDLTALATGELFSAATSLGVDSIYDADEIEKLEEASEELAEDWLDEIYDANSRLSNTDWLNMVTSEKGRWIFDPVTLRTKLFEKAEIE